jgi:hypothetical protein
LKGIASLLDKKDGRIQKYTREELMKILGDNRYHSPEISESDQEQGGKRAINVYNPSWRSVEVR